MRDYYLTGGAYLHFDFRVSMKSDRDFISKAVESFLTYDPPKAPMSFRLEQLVTMTDFWFEPFYDPASRDWYYKPGRFIEIQDTAPTKWRWRLPVHPKDPWSIRTLYLACQVSIHDYERSSPLIMDALLNEIKDSLLPEQQEKFLI